MKNLWLIFSLGIALSIYQDGFSIPMYDEGALLIGGVQLLRHKDHENQYYYLPQYPHLAKKRNGDFELLCIKYLGAGGVESGGLFHALIEFTLPNEVLELVLVELKKIKPDAIIIGPVPLIQPKNDPINESPPRFELVSAILNDTKGSNPFTKNVVYSGHAPLTPGSKAAVAALLSQQGATLLWDSFTGSSSDVSVTVYGYYEAYVRGYNAIVTAEMDIIYKHFSEITRSQSGFPKKDIRNVVDSLQNLGSLKVDVFDRTQSLNIRGGDLENILDLVTNKLVELMFDATTGWAKEPDRVDPTLGFTERGRQGDKSKTEAIVGNISEALLLASPFGWFRPRQKKDENPEYITDDQYLLKNIEDIRSRRFYLNLSRAGTTRVPIISTGNLGGIYDEFGNDRKYFRIVDLNDSDFERRSVHFHVDRASVDGFEELVNFVSVNFKKKYPSNTHQADVVQSISIRSEDIIEGSFFKAVQYPRFGLNGKEFTEYEYQVIWSLKGSDTPIRFPADKNQWITSQDSDVLLALPFEQTEIIIDADRPVFNENGFSSASLVFATTRAGRPEIIRNVVLRSSDRESTNKIYLYRDPGEPIVYQTSWYSPQGEKRLNLEEMKSTYLYLIPPIND